MSLATGSNPCGFSRRAGAAALGVALVALIGCGSSDKKNPVSPPGGGGTTTTFTGSITGATESGRIAVTVSTTSLGPAGPARAGAVMVMAAGSVTINGGAAIALTGSYDPATDVLAVSGGGYTFNGFYDVEFPPPAITGSYTGPNGPGNFVCPVGDGTAVKVFCGRYQNIGSTANGSWNFLISGTNVVGYSWPTGAAETQFLYGTVTGTGTTQTISVSAGAPGFALAATGTLDTTTNVVSGTWNATDPVDGSPLDSGTWSGSLCP